MDMELMQEESLTSQLNDFIQKYRMFDMLLQYYPHVLIQIHLMIVATERTIILCNDTLTMIFVAKA